MPVGRADTDRDGKVTQAEFRGAALARFDAADTDHDGTLTAAERRAGRGSWGGGERGGRPAMPPPAPAG